MSTNHARVIAAFEKVFSLRNDAGAVRVLDHSLTNRRKLSVLEARLSSQFAQLYRGTIDVNIDGPTVGVEMRPM